MMEQKYVVFSSEKPHAINVNHYVFIKYIQCLYSVVLEQHHLPKNTEKYHCVKTKSKVTLITIFLIIAIMSLSNIVWLKCFRYLDEKVEMDFFLFLFLS